MITKEELDRLAIEIKKMERKYLTDILSEMATGLDEKEQQIFLLSHKVKILDKIIMYKISQLHNSI